MAKKKSQEIEFPFEPNEKVKEAFRRYKALKDAATIIIEAFYHVLSEQTELPWQVLAKEHPEVTKTKNAVTYNHISQTIQLKQ